MHKFVRNLITEWRKLEFPFSGETLVVAVSGGADSVSLLLALTDLQKRKKLDLRLVAAHFDHRLRGNESSADGAFVEDLAQHLSVEYVRGQMPRPDRGNLEEFARHERYAFLEQTAAGSGAFAVATGHTVNDQAETFLMNLIRGSGSKGLSAMIPDRKLGSTRLIRPLLSWAKREDTEEFCRDAGIEFREDAMNQDPRFTRVRIRKEVIPLLEEFNPKIVQTLAATARLLDQRCDNDAADFPELLVVAELKQLSKPELYQILRGWIGSRRGSLRSVDLKHIEGIEQLISSRKSGRESELPGGWRVVKQGGKLRLRNIMVDK